MAAMLADGLTAIALFWVTRGGWRLSRRKRPSFGASLPRTPLAGRLAILLTISIAKVFVRHVASDGMRRPSMATRSGHGIDFQRSLCRSYRLE
jgi:hypothetical protein